MRGLQEGRVKCTHRKSDVDGTEADLMYVMHLIIHARMVTLTAQHAWTW
jgi:hypothetical protein